MAKTNLYPADFYMNPNFVLDRFQLIIEKYGLDQALQNRKFQVEREAWITAVFLLGYSTITGRVYWVGINPDDTTPDTYGVSFPELEKGLSRQILNYEVFEWEAHTKDDLIGVILKKLKHKSYPDYFGLICYIRDHEGEELNPKLIHDELQKHNITVGSIWLLFNIAGEEYHKHCIVQVFPCPSMVCFNYLEEAKKLSKQKDLIKVTGRGTKKTFEDLGIYYLPLP